MRKPSQKRIHRERRHHRVRAKISGSGAIPRVAVFRSARHIYAQAIDDAKRQTLCSVNDLVIKEKNKTIRSHKAGELLGDMIKKKGIERILFDRGGFRYHGRVKALAEGLRKNGIKF